MKNFVIKELSLYDFKGQTRTFTPNDLSTHIRGVNGIGKTTLYKAFSWLMTGYTDAITSKNYELYDNTKEISQSTPQAIVKAKVLVDDIDYTIERRAKAKFVKKRGENEWVKDSSDSYTLLIDDIETSVSDFNSWVERNIGSVDLLPYMLIGERFANLTIDDKNKARKILEQVVGEISFNDMKGDYTMIKKHLAKFSVDELKTRFKKELKALSDKSNELDVKNKFQQGDFDSYNEINFDEIATRIEDLSEEIDELDKSIRERSKSVEPLVREREKTLKLIHSKCVELGDKRLAYNERCNDELHALYLEIKNTEADNRRIEEQNNKAKSEHEKFCNDLESKKKFKEQLLAEREKLVKERNEVKARVFDGEICKYCGQPLPFVEIEDARRKFNEQKQSDLELVIEKGKSIKQSIDSIEEEILKLEEVVSRGYKEIKPIDVSELKQAYEDKKQSIVKFEDTEEYAILTKEIDELKANIPQVVYINEDERKQRDEYVEERAKLQAEYQKKELLETIASSIEKNNQAKREIGNEMAQIEGFTDKVKEYEEEKANIVSERINKKMNGCRIVMYSRQKDGELKADCVIESKDGIKYATLNNSARNLVCLSLQRMFCEHFGMNMPIFVDDAERYSSDNLPKFDSQTIYLFVSNDKELVIE